VDGYYSSARGFCKADSAGTPFHHLRHSRGSPPLIFWARSGCVA